MESLEWGRSNRLNRIRNLTHEERCKEDPYYSLGFHAGREGNPPGMCGESYMEGYALGRREYKDGKYWDDLFAECARIEGKFD
jgi:hypothetical protein